MNRHSLYGSRRSSLGKSPDQTPPLQPRKNLLSDVPDRPMGVVNAPEMQSILKFQQEAIKQHDEAVRLVSGLERIEMPTREFLSPSMVIQRGTLDLLRASR